MAELPAAAPVGISKLVGELRLMVTLADSLDDRVEWLNALCAAVRAEAVADERQRLLTELHRPGFVQAAIDRACATHFTDDAGNDIGTMPASHAVVAIVAVATELAAGSVPVATPPDYFIITKHPDGSLTTAPGPVATPTEPADPTYGRIDPDIQRAVDALEPESIGSRVAMENTLQARRDAATPTEPAIDMGFLSFGAGVEVDDLAPLVPAERCPCKACAGPDGGETRCKCDLCIRSAIWRPESTCICRLCEYARGLAASPVPAVQPPAHDPGCERQLHNDWCLCVQRAARRAP